MKLKQSQLKQRVGPLVLTRIRMKPLVIDPTNNFLMWNCLICSKKGKILLWPTTFNMETIFTGQ